MGPGLVSEILRTVGGASGSGVSGGGGKACSPLGESGEKEGKLVSDLSSEAAMELAELEGWELSFDRLARTVCERPLLMDVALCCETERSRGRVGSGSMLVGGR